MTKTKSKKVYKVVYTRSQKIKGWLALIMLFVCGVMVGAGFANNKTETDVSLGQNLQEQVQKSQQKETCAVIEEIQVEMDERTEGESYLGIINSVKYMMRMLTSILLIQGFRK